MIRRRKLSPRDREKLYRDEVAKAENAGRGEVPICNLCDRPVTPDQAWDESHDPHAPRAFGGTIVGIAHRLCNRLHGAKYVTPAVAKAKRIWRRHHGVTRPGMGFSRLPGGRDSPLKKKLSGEVVRR